MRRKLIGLSSAVALTVLGLAVPANAVTAHSRAASGACYFINSNYGNTHYALTDNGQNAEVTTSTQFGDGDCWRFINGQRWTIPYNGHIVNVYELQDTNTDLCLNVGSNWVVYANSCHAGDWNELFWHSGPLGTEWYINVEGTETFLYQTPLYANHISDGSSVSISLSQPGPNANDMWQSCDIANGCS